MISLVKVEVPCETGTTKGDKNVAVTRRRVNLRAIAASIIFHGSTVVMNLAQNQVKVVHIAANLQIMTATAAKKVVIPTKAQTQMGAMR